ncbi:DUF5959 family protein [Kitasatospora sp. NPDC101183]|uniref:DUF5959 family protein n=1 Tax=Kitasatospora sp. NPDC101183 TaxID=3364100 RepID=UPI0037F1770C
MDLALYVSKLESWANALDRLDAGEDIAWMEMSRGPSIFIQLTHQKQRSADSPGAREYLDSLLGRPCDRTPMSVVANLVVLDPGPTAPDFYGDVEAVLYGLRYAHSEAAPEENFGHLPESIARRARRIAEVLAEEYQPQQV